MNTEPAPRERNPFLEAVGRVTIAGAQLDHSLLGLLGTLAFEPTLLTYANAASTDQLIEFCRLALTVRTIEAEDIAEVTSCLDRAKVLKDKRNTIVHSIYMAEGESGGLEAMKPRRKKFGLSVKELTIEEMEAVADDIAELRNDLFRAGWNKSSRETGLPSMPSPGGPAQEQAAGA